MNRDEQQGTWVLLVVLCTLFVVSVATPHRWRLLLGPQSACDRLVMRLDEQTAGTTRRPTPPRPHQAVAEPGPALQPVPPARLSAKQKPSPGTEHQHPSRQHGPWEPQPNAETQPVAAQPRPAPPDELVGEHDQTDPGRLGSVSVHVLGEPPHRAERPAASEPPAATEPPAASASLAVLEPPVIGTPCQEVPRCVCVPHDPWAVWLCPPPSVWRAADTRPGATTSDRPAAAPHRCADEPGVDLCHQPTDSEPLCRLRPVVPTPSNLVMAAPVPAWGSATNVPEPTLLEEQMAGEVDLPLRPAQDRTVENPARLPPCEEVQPPCEEVANRKGPWRLPQQIEARLELLAAECAYSGWASGLLRLVQELAETADQHPARAIEILGELRWLTDEQHPTLRHARAEGVKGASLCDRFDPAAAVLQVATAVRRLLATWELVAPLPASAAGLASRRAERMELADGLAAQQELARWREARDRWAEAILAYEAQRLPSLARAVVSETVTLAGEAWLGRDRLDSHVSTHYRGANFRLAVHARLLNRFVPPQPTVELPVNERVLGLPTRGWSTTNTAVRVRLLPDPHCVRLHLEAEGVVAARTSSSAGLATLFNASQSPFLARKEIVVAPHGLLLQPSRVQADSSTRLRRVQTEFDGVPILAQIVEGIVRSRHEKSRARLRHEARRKVVARVSEQLDSTANERVEALAERIETRLLTPLTGLDLAPEVVELSTSAERATARVRLASPVQLAAHTPRPLAPAQSLASLQIHESLLNNIVERLELNGQSCTLPELQALICQRLQLPPETLTASYSDELHVTFAAQDAVYLRFDQGRVELQLNLAEIRTPAKTWRDVSAKVYLRPQRSGLHAQLVRDGAVQLTGPRLRGRMLIALRGVFCKMFPSERPVELMPERILQDPRLADLEVAQLVLEDGWMGLALAPAPPAATARWHCRRYYPR